MRHDRIRDYGPTFPATPEGLRKWAKQIKDDAKRKADALEAMATQIERETEPLWPQRSIG